MEKDKLLIYQLRTVAISLEKNVSASCWMSIIVKMAVSRLSGGPLRHTHHCLGAAVRRTPR